MFCRKCGKQIAEDSKFCDGCGTGVGSIQSTTQNNVQSATTQTPQHQQSGPSFTPASQGKRFMNYFLDYIFFIVLLVIYYALFGTSDTTSTTEGDTSLVFYLIYPLYFVFFEGIWQKTPAKFLSKTKVITREGAKPSFGTILVRSLCRLIPLDAFTYLSVNPVGWHDSISKTLVVDEGSF